MKARIEALCKDCGNKTFKMTKGVEGEDEGSIIISETLCHDGFGYDLNTFEIICSKCGKKNNEIFELKDNKRKVKA